MTTRATSVRARLATEMGELLAELDADLARVAHLAPVAAVREQAARLRLDLVAQRERATAPVVVTLVGASGAGKSTLLNALAGRPIATEGVNRPTTVEPVIYAPSDAALDELVGSLPGPAPRIERYRGEEGGPWSEHVLIDAPDVNSIADAHREVVRTLAERSDALLVLVHPQSIAEEVSVRFVAEFAGRRRVLPELGRAAELSRTFESGLCCHNGPCWHGGLCCYCGLAA